MSEAKQVSEMKGETKVKGLELGSRASESNPYVPSVLARPLLEDFLHTKAHPRCKGGDPSLVRFSGQNEADLAFWDGVPPNVLIVKGFVSPAIVDDVQPISNSNEI